MHQPLFQHTKQAERCPQCGAELQLRHGKKGLFWGCSSYPECDYLRPVHQTQEVKVLKVLEQNCPECGHWLALKQGQFGMFIGCSNYPECHFVVHEQDAPQQSEHFPCPECQQGELVARRGSRGKTFYGCNRFPDCKYTLPSKPYKIQCPHCASQLALLKKTQGTQQTFQCANKACRQIFVQESIDE